MGWMNWSLGPKFSDYNKGVASASHKPCSSLTQIWDYLWPLALCGRTGFEITHDQQSDEAGGEQRVTFPPLVPSPNLICCPSLRRHSIINDLSGSGTISTLRERREEKGKGHFLRIWADLIGQRERADIAAGEAGSSNSHKTQILCLGWEELPFRHVGEKGWREKMLRRCYF